MLRSRTLLWTIAALLGIAVTATLAWTASQIAGQRIGLASEPLSVAAGLAPAAVSRHTVAASQRTAETRRHPTTKPPADRAPHTHTVTLPSAPAPASASSTPASAAGTGGSTSTLSSSSAPQTPAAPATPAAATSSVGHTQSQSRDDNGGGSSSSGGSAGGGHRDD